MAKKFTKDKKIHDVKSTSYLKTGTAAIAPHPFFASGQAMSLSREKGDETKREDKQREVRSG